MFPSSALLSLALLAISSVAASPIQRNTGKFSLAFAARVNATGSRNIAEHDRARAAALRQNAQSGNAKRATVSIDNAVVTYTASVGVGSPPTQYTLVIDTGSSNTWIGAGKGYTPTSTSSDTGNAVSVSYGSGFFSGEEYTDVVTLSDDLVITQQSIGVASTSNGMIGIDGILGIGPVGLTSGTVSNTDTVPTVSNNLYSAGTISTEIIGIYYFPAAESGATGTLDFGATDCSQCTGDITYTPITSIGPASEYWGIDQSISYGGSIILDSTAGIVDTGTTFLLLASDAYSRYQSATGSTLDSATGLLKITSEQFSALSDLDIVIGGTTFTLSANAQIWPRSLNSQIGGESGSIYLIVSDLGSSSGSGLDFINGYVFLERFYTVFDSTNSQVGFATTTYTTSTSN
ncbi:hypothetical protein HWV62_29404 [Athelia sp. TMB]|nr:hypothetical protein HWV62_29404 [Athelia sp. TMB]